MSSSSARRVSVIVPTRDRPDLLREALASIRALEGSDLTFEILVGDNGSQVETRAVAEAFGARYLHTERAGAGAARNVALRAATAPYLAFLDDDDLWLPAHVRKHVALLDSHPDLSAVVGQVISTDSNRIPIGEPWPAVLPDDGALFLTMIAGYFPQIGATVTRASMRDDNGEFDESLIGDQDWDWHLRMAAHHRIGFVADPCVLFRQRPPGSYDALQLKRVGYTRRVFLRHAVPAWRLWPSPRAFIRAYGTCLGHYYSYFVNAAFERAQRGERAMALQAAAGAFRVGPARSIWDALTETPLRAALLAASRGETAHHAPGSPVAAPAPYRDGATGSPNLRDQGRR
jgi:glycosyltransferase involved in cell wall biosynthesis